MTPTNKRSFWALIFTQFWGAFNDNLLKVLIQLLVVQWVTEALMRQQLVNLATTVFDIPFLMFSMLAGRVADRFPKPSVIRGVQIWQIAMASIAAASILEHNIPAMMASLALLAMQATFFSPAKYGVLPELMGESELSNGNGILNMATFVAILVGTIAGSFMTGHLLAACLLLIAGSGAGMIGSLFLQKLPAAKPEIRFGRQPLWLVLCTLALLALVGIIMRISEWTFPDMVGVGIVGGLMLTLFVLANGSDLWQNWKIIRQDRALKLGIIAVNYFWFIGAILLTNLFLYAKEMMHVNEKVSGFLLIAVTLGIALGSFSAGRLSRGKVELGLVPVGGFGMSFFTLDMLWAWHSLPRALIDLFLIGFFAGLYEIPLNALIQWRSPQTDRGRVLATQNFLSFVAILGGSAALWLLGSRMQLNPAQVLFVMGLISLVGSIVTYLFVPDAMLRFIVYAVTSVLYKLRIDHGENVPVKGPALLICNHLSLADGFLVSAAVPRPIRFLMWRPYYEDKWLHWLVKSAKAIPISEKDSPRQILNSLLEARKAVQNGEVVCLFAEGQISRTGNLLEFKRGFEIIVKDLNVPVIPIHLDRLWGSIFSFEHGKVIFKWPRRIPYPVTVTVGKPIQGPITPERVRQAVMDLGAEAFNHRLENGKPLVVEFLERAKSQPFALAMADSLGKELSFSRLAAAAKGFAEVIRKEINARMPDSEAAPIGLLLPSSVGGALANLAVSLLGHIPINLNYTAGASAIDHAVKKAGIQLILTSRKLLEKTGLPERPEMVFLEDLAPRVSKAGVLIEQALFVLLPKALAIRRIAKEALSIPLSATATIVFSSGSTGVPKGVVLTHANILSNILGISQVFDLGRKDRMMGILPLFHSFGFTVTLWFPLIKGFSVIYHTNPLDAKIIGDLAEKYKATVMLSTPTFLGAYTRKCRPEQFKYLRYVITGAERMRESIAKAFQEKFGVTALEGYGTTELSPVATVNIPNVSMGEINQVGNKPGKIGHPIPGVSVKIVDPDTFADRPQGEPGMLLVKGPNVMKEYLGEPEKTAQAMHDGWYITGDIAQIDHDGFVQIVDRLSRFSKIAGEMVPHMLLEDKLHQIAQSNEAMFAVTSVPDEKKGEQLVVLYIPCAIDEMYKKLQDSDIPKLWVPARDHFFEVPALPLLGTGKIDLQRLKQIAKEKTSTL